MKKNWFYLIFFFLFLSFSFPGLTQQKSSIPSDLSKIQVDQLTDDQIKSLIQKAEQSGLTLDQMQSLAMSRGMSMSEINKLKQRVEKLQQGGGTNNNNQKAVDRTRSYNNPNDQANRGASTDNGQGNNLSNQEDLFSDFLKKEATERPEDRIFGFALFNRENLTFEPSLNIATPENYQLGPGDEVIIDVWGASQQTYDQKISPEGSIMIDNLGPVYLSGLTIEEATRRAKKELLKIYAGLGGGLPNTFLKVSLGSVRSIKVNILGDVFVPGTYTLPSLATVFNALYAAGGPALTGSLREIKVIRSNKTIAELDFYNYLLKGEQENNIRLQDNDVVFVNPYKNRVEVKGEVKRPLFYDMKRTETALNLIDFAGGYTGQAYTKRIRVIRKTDWQNKVLDIPKMSLDTLHLVNGDKVLIDTVLDRFENRVEISGAVYRPGMYALDTGMTLKQLIKKADGLKDDVFKNRVIITRTRDDNRLEVIPVDISDKSNGSDSIILRREDAVFIPSIFDLQEDFTVRIDGEVRKPGIYPYHQNTTVEDLIIQAGGLRESASLTRVEIARRIKNNLSEQSSKQVAEIYQFQISSDFKLGTKGSQFILEPFDQVFIRNSPGYEIQTEVRIEGEVAFPGTYVIANKAERISDLIKRAGGVTDDAYIKGAKLIRKIPLTKKDRQLALEAIRAQVGDSVKFTPDIDTVSTVGIRLDKILASNGSKYDLLLEKDDVVKVPKELQVVRLSGSVLSPVMVRYDQSFTFRNYISSAGGFAPEAKKSKSYVIYANGSIDRTRKIFFFNSYPKVEPGAEIIVPKKPERVGMTPQESIGLATAMSSMALIIVTLITKL